MVAVCSTNRGQGRAEQGKGEGEQGQLSAGVCRAQRESTERVQRERESDRAGQGVACVVVCRVPLDPCSPPQIHTPLCLLWLPPRPRPLVAANAVASVFQATMRPLRGASGVSVRLLAAPAARPQNTPAAAPFDRESGDRSGAPAPLLACRAARARKRRRQRAPPACPLGQAERSTPSFSRPFPAPQAQLFAKAADPPLAAPQRGGGAGLSGARANRLRRVPFACRRAA